jgi:hypothetical protein
MERRERLIAAGMVLLVVLIVLAVLFILADPGPTSMDYSPYSPAT